MMGFEPKLHVIEVQDERNQGLSPLACHVRRIFLPLKQPRSIQK